MMNEFCYCIIDWKTNILLFLTSKMSELDRSSKTDDTPMADPVKQRVMHTFYTFYEINQYYLIIVCAHCFLRSISWQKMKKWLNYQCTLHVRWQNVDVLTGKHLKSFVKKIQKLTIVQHLQKNVEILHANTV